MPNHKECINIDDLRLHAKRRLPKSVFEFIDGGAHDEITLRNNNYDFRNFKFVPRVLTDISHRNQEVDLFGQRYSTPLVLGSIELADLVWFGAKGRITQLWRQLTKTYPFAPHQCQHAASKRSPKKRRQDSGFNSMSCETEALLESLFVALKKRTAACWSSPLTPNYSGHENGIYATALWFPQNSHSQHCLIF